MTNLKPVLIVENCLSGLQKNEGLSTERKEYILSGTFTEFNVRNRNDRIYTSPKFLPHLQELLERKKQIGVVYGEFDHPDVFDTSLKRVSHTIESAVFNTTKNTIEGSIRLLNTTWGKEAKALVDDNCPIFVSSRAAGITESNGEVTIKKLFTYDAVADPGFSSARMALNESLGFNESANFRIYEVTDESKINQLFNMNNDDVVTKEQMEEYSAYLTNEISKVSEEMNKVVKEGKTSPEKIEELAQYYSNLNESFNKVSNYLDYLAENVQILVNENKGLKERTDNLVKHNDYLVENLNKSIKYSEYLAEKLDKSIDYGEYIAETLSNSIDFAEYIAEHVHKNIKYSEYLAEKLDSTIVYSEYIAENVDKSIDFSNYLAENLDTNIAYGEYLAENLDNTIKYGEYVAEHVDNSIAYGEYIAENLSDTQAYSKYLAESVDKTIDYQKYLAESMKTSKVNEALETPEERMGNLKVDNIDAYYDDEEKDGDEVIDVQNDDTVVEPVDGETNQPVSTEVPAQGEVQPSAQVEQPTTPAPAQPAAQVQPVAQPTAQPVAQPTMTIIPGMSVELTDGTTGEVVATNPQNGIVVISVASVNAEAPVQDGEVAPVQDDEAAPVPTEGGVQPVQPAAQPAQPAQPVQAQLKEVQESSIVRVLGDKIVESQESLLENIKTLIAESKKRKASEEKEPHFLLFMGESNKANWLNLSDNDKEKVIVAMNESKYTSEGDVMKIMQKALLAGQKSFNEVIVAKVPEALKPVWESLDVKSQNGILAQAKLYNLNSNDKIESFWNSRGLNELTALNEKKIISTTPKFVDNSQLSDAEVDKFISVFKNLR